jgi:hypothetical protein
VIQTCKKKRRSVGSARSRSLGVEFDLHVLVICRYRCQSEGIVLVCLGTTTSSSDYRIENLASIFLLVGEKVRSVSAQLERSVLIIDHLKVAAAGAVISLP